MYDTWHNTLISPKVIKLSHGISKKRSTNLLATSESVSECKTHHDINSIHINNLDREQINFVKKYSSVYDKDLRRINLGPFTWPSLFHSDPMMNKLESYILKRRPEFSFSAYNAQLTEESKALHWNPQSDVTARVQRLNAYRGIFQDLRVDITIKVELPARSVISRYLDCFFTAVYEFMPIFDETSFRRHVYEMIPDNGLPISAIHVTNKIQLARAGSLILILRFTSLFCQDRNQNEQDSILMDNPISVSTVRVTHEILDQFNLSVYSSLEILQFMMAFKKYHRHGPETTDGVDDCDAHLFLENAIFLAKSLGVNRESSQKRTSDIEGEYLHLKSKIWFLLVFWDIRRACICGTPLIIGDADYDIPFPTYSDEVSNVNDVETERRCIAVFQDLREYYFPIRNLLQSCLDLNKSISVRELTAAIDEYSKKLQIINNDIRLGIMKPVHKISLAFNSKLIIYMDLKCCFMCMYFLLLLQSEQNDGTGSSYLDSIQKIITVDIKSMCEIFFESSHFYEVLIAPSIESAIQKANIIMNSLILRKERTPDPLCWLHIYPKKFVIFSSRLSKNYCYAWQTTKAQIFLLELLTAKDLDLGEVSEFKRNDSLQLENLFDETRVLGKDLFPTSPSNLLEVDNYWMNYLGPFDNPSEIEGHVRFDDLFYSPGMFVLGNKEYYSW